MFVILQAARLNLSTLSLVCQQRGPCHYLILMASDLQGRVHDFESEVVKLRPQILRARRSPCVSLKVMPSHFRYLHL